MSKSDDPNLFKGKRLRPVKFNLNPTQLTGG